MEGKERRELLVTLLKEAKSPLSGSELAKKLNVSRQIIVQDIALLRAVNRQILSTTKGYLLYEEKPETIKRCVCVSHTTNQIEDELLTITDLGGKILDVTVVHDIYGPICVDLMIASRQDVYDFVKKVDTKKTTPLKELTGGLHYHTIEAKNEEILDQIEAKLKLKNYLVSSNKT